MVDELAGHVKCGDLTALQKESLKTAFRFGRIIETKSLKEQNWVETKNPMWLNDFYYRVKPDHQEAELSWTIDGLVKINWIKKHRDDTGCGLREALDKWNELEAAGKNSSTEITKEDVEQGYLCVISEVDIAKDELVIQMKTKLYTVGPGFYKLVRVSL